MLTHEIPPDFRGGVHLFIKNRHTSSGQSRVNRVTQLRTDGAHCRESAGTGPVVLKVVPVTGAAILQVTMDQLMCTSLQTDSEFTIALILFGASGAKKKSRNANKQTKKSQEMSNVENEVELDL